MTDSSESTESMLAQLPMENFWDIPLYQWQGLRYRSYHLQATMDLRSHFSARHDDIILASPMKTGTTWLKALCFSILNAAASGGDNRETLAKTDEDHRDPLVENHPAVYVQTLEVQVYTSNPLPNISSMKSPRLFHTHFPYTALPDSVKTTGCKLVYIARNPKDTLVSMWHFFNNLRTPQQGPYPFEKAFEMFINGVSHFGPFFDHVLQYWNQSLKAPNKVLFLKYEDLKGNPIKEVKKLASFMGKPFGDDKKVEDEIWQCSLERLKNLEVNKNGVDPWAGMHNSAYFRTGIVGDWKNMMSDEMSQRLDRITESKFKGSGLCFEI
ncbi:putative nutrient reservoir [Hibiscus syriacus]|uniref:Sulfotransferase n=1 Tax=Hibiscus syriacus TaxID=106335 RepID=A0A6A3B1P3_HIBSY|nr:cytosolic sulfotransferase 5-like [Hibiscus syriacus]KAE8708999.1 putative nutrient reservoir [Hibiscus syriacus]